MSDSAAYKHFGLSCSDGGKYYICEDSDTQFMGCCTSDPCGSNNGTCPDGDLRAASFNADMYDELPTQDCDDSRGTAIYYTCKFNSPPFMGCCSQNACANSGCSRSRLIPSKLSPVEKNRLNFLEPSGSSETATSTSTSTSTSSSTAEPSKDDDGGLGTGAIAGIAVGAAVVGILVVAFLLWKCWWKPRKDKANGQQFQPVNTTGQAQPPQQPDTPGAYSQGNFSPTTMVQSPMSGYQQSYAPTAAGYYPNGASPDMSQKYSPQVSQFDRPYSTVSYSDNGSIASPHQGYAQPYGGGNMIPVQEMDGTTTMAAQELGTGEEHSIQQNQHANSGLGISK